ncbi:MAG: M15 family metallopeptidase [Telluria sp.]
MLIYIALLYFLLVCRAGWALAFRHGGRTLARGALARRVRRRPAAAAGLVALIAFPPLTVLLLDDVQTLPPAAPAAADARILALLDGEHLAPPAPLPPLAFSTAEVEAVRPLLSTASRDWERLDAGFSQRLLLAFRIMRERYGYDMALLEGYRSPARQDQLAAQGSSVTNARAWQSYHQYGLAADCAFWRDGKLVISEKDPWALRGYQLYGAVAESLGLVWGGRWKMLDLGHIELHSPRRAP